MMTSPLSVFVVLDATLGTIGYGYYCAHGTCTGVIVFNHDATQQKLDRNFKHTAANYDEEL
jgi:hypothetical protein